MSTETEQPDNSIRFSTAVIHNGRYIGLGESTPFMTETDVPENLKPYITAAGNESLPHPSDRDIYMTPQARRQARRLEVIADEKEWCEAQASEPLREDVQAALEDAHAKHIGLAKAQMVFNQSAIDVAHEAATAAAELAQFFVKRGSVFSRVEKVKAKPGEPCFVKLAGGDWQLVGTLDSKGEPPPQPIII